MHDYCHWKSITCNSKQLLLQRVACSLCMVLALMCMVDRGGRRRGSRKNAFRARVFPRAVHFRLRERSGLQRLGQKLQEKGSSYFFQSRTPSLSVVQCTHDISRDKIDQAFPSYCKLFSAPAERRVEVSFVPCLVPGLPTVQFLEQQLMKRTSLL